MRDLRNLSLILMMFFYFPVCINAQHNQWTWAGGNNISNQYGNYGPKGTSGNNFIPGARNFGLSWVDNNGNLWLFGGQGYSTSSDASGGKTIDYLNDLWKYNNGNWTWVSGANFHNQNGSYGPLNSALSTNYPGARNYSTGCVDLLGNYWMYGGQGYASDPNNQYCLDDLWKWDGTNWTWVFGDHTQSAISYHTAIGIADPGNYPGSREGGNSWTDNNGNFWLFGGNANDDATPTPTQGLCNDVWKWDGTNWTWMSGSNSFNQNGIYTGTPGTLTPGARQYSTGCRDKYGNYWLFGGLDNSTQLYNDLWEWNGTSWIWVSGSNSMNQPGIYTGSPGSLVPGGRAGAMMWFDETGNLWLFGGGTLISGSSTPYYYNDLWKWDGTNWTLISGGSSPLPSSDPSTGTYGTMGSSSSTTTPGVRAGGAYAADKGGYIWLIGGGDFYINNVAANMVNDVWKFQYGYNTIKDGNWNIPATWENNAVPAATDFAIIKNVVSVTDIESITGVKVNPGTILNVNPGNLQVSGTLNSSGSIDATAGTITLNGSIPQGFATSMLKNSTIKNLTITNASSFLLRGSLNLTGVLNLSGGTFYTQGLLTLGSNASSTGAVLFNGGSINGNVTVQRYLSQNQRGWRLLGNPLAISVSYATLASGSTTPIDMTYGATSSAGASAETYDPPTNTWLGAVSSTNLWNSESGIALFIRGHQGQGFGSDYPTYGNEGGVPGNVTLAINGPLNTSAASIPTTTGAFNLIANPFAAPISLSAVLAANSGYNGTVAIYDPTLGSSSAIVKAGGYNTSYTPIGVAGGAGDLIIPSMGAFFVTSTSGTSFTIPTSAIFTGTPSAVATYGGSDRMKLTVNSGTVNYDQLNFQFDANSTAATGDKYDFGKLPNTYLNFYSISSNNQQLAFDERNAVSQTIPLGLKSSVTNNFTIAVDQYNLPENYSLVLKDKLLNTSTVLQSGTSYNFSITADTATQGDNRFEIDVNKAVVNTITNDNTGVTKVTIGPNPSNDFIEVKTPVSIIAGASYNIRLLGTNGNPVSSISIAAGASVQIPLKGYASGLYLVEVNDGKQISTYKIIKN